MVSVCVYILSLETHKSGNSIAMPVRIHPLKLFVTTLTLVHTHTYLPFSSSPKSSWLFLGSISSGNEMALYSNTFILRIHVQNWHWHIWNVSTWNFYPQKWSYRSKIWYFYYCLTFMFQVFIFTFHTYHTHWAKVHEYGRRIIIKWIL